MQALSREQLDRLDSIWKAPGFLAVLIAVGAAFGSWAMLLSVLPLAIIDSGGGEALAGATTGVFMAATVLTQVNTPKALRRFGYTPVMIFSVFMLGIPAFAYVWSTDTVPVLVISVIRGIGFGALTVAESALIAELSPRKLLGKASGLLGLVIGVVQMILLPVGLELARRVSFDLVYVIGALIALLAAPTILLVPRLRPDSVENKEHASAATWKLVAIPALAINVVSMGFGAVSAFLPPAMAGALLSGFILSIVGFAQLSCRYVAGLWADRHGAGTLTVLGLGMGLLGLGTMAAVIAFDWSGWWLVAAAVLFGGGYGIIQNESLLMMFARLPRTRVSDASAIWNMAYDSGTGLGSFILGFVAVRWAYVGVFTGAAIIIGVGLTAAALDRVMGRYRIAEIHNTRAQLRRIPLARRLVK